MIKLRLRICNLANQEHQLSKRQYAHVGHVRDTICIANAFYRLPIQHRAALLAHEAGHVLARKYNKSDGEAVADRMAEQFFGVKIQYIDSKYGGQLEYLSPTQARKVLERVITGYFNPQQS